MKNSQCFQYKRSRFSDLSQFFAEFPVIEFKMDSEQYYKWYPQGYLYNDPQMNDATVFCYAFAALSANRVYLGGTWMKGHEILFDRQNKKIFIKENPCSSSFGQSNFTTIIESDPKIQNTESDLKYFQDFSRYLNINPKDDNLDGFASIFYNQMFYVVVFVILASAALAIIRIKKKKTIYERM